MTRITYLGIIFILVISGCKSNEGNLVNPEITSSGKPDLKIDGITYTRLPNCYQDYPSGIICGGPRFEFNIKIKNIGDADLTKSFYISNSRSETDFNDSYCSHTTIVNYPIPNTLSAGGYVEVKFIDVIDDQVPYVFFVINTNNRYDRGVLLPIIDEQNYDNEIRIRAARGLRRCGALRRFQAAA